MAGFSSVAPERMTRGRSPGNEPLLGLPPPHAGESVSKFAVQSWLFQWLTSSPVIESLSGQRPSIHPSDD